MREADAQEYRSKAGIPCGIHPRQSPLPNCAASPATPAARAGPSILAHCSLTKMYCLISHATASSYSSNNRYGAESDEAAQRIRDTLQERQAARTIDHHDVVA